RYAETTLAFMCLGTLIVLLGPGAATRSFEISLFGAREADLVVLMAYVQAVDRDAVGLSVQEVTKIVVSRYTET
ncbi:UNVERIFIED_CONTAM: hypothetical protein NY603_25175, partial [Bacteroidetes bacterium 56_B9]